MRSLALKICFLATAIAMLTGAAFASAGDARGKRAPAKVTVLGCHDGDDVVTFRGRMRRVRGSVRMAMRFGLRERGEDGRFVRVKAPGLGRLRRSRPGVRRFVFRQRVAGVQEGHEYRAVVRYAWYDGRGRVIRRARRRSSVCREADGVINLRVVRMRAWRSTPSGTARYAVRVENTGNALAEKVAVVVAVDGASLDTRVIDRLEPEESKVVYFMGPVCKRTLSAEIDPLDEIAETRTDDNRLLRSCPF